DWPLLLRCARGHIGFRCTFWMRLCAFFESNERSVPLALCKRILRRQQTRYGIEIPYRTTVGPGICVGHFGGIFVHPSSVLGPNLTICQGVTVGETRRGKRKGTPTIGRNVYLAPGAKVLG